MSDLLLIGLTAKQTTTNICFQYIYLIYTNISKWIHVDTNVENLLSILWWSLPIADQVITSGQNIFHNFLKWKVRVIDFALMQMQL